MKDKRKEHDTANKPTIVQQFCKKDDNCISLLCEYIGALALSLPALTQADREAGWPADGQNFAKFNFLVT